MPAQLLVDVRGSRRDISDQITMVDAKSTPLFSMIPKGSQTEKNQLAEWPMDKNIDPVRSANIDGTDVADFDNALAKYQVGANYMQWFRNSAMVGKLALVGQNQAGVTNKLAKAVAKKMVQMKRMLEISIGSDDAAAQPTGAVAGVSRGMGDFIKASAQAILPIPADYLTPAGNIDTTATASLTENIVQGVLESQYKQTGQRKTYSVPCGVAFKKAFRLFQQTATASTNVMSSIRTFAAQQEAQKIVWSVDVYEGDWGVLELIPTLWNAYLTAGGATQDAVTQARAYVLDMENWEWIGQQTPQRADLPDQGGGPRFLIDAIGCLKCANPLAEGKFAATS